MAKIHKTKFIWFSLKHPKPSPQSSVYVMVQSLSQENILLFRDIDKSNSWSWEKNLNLNWKAGNDMTHDYLGLPWAWPQDWPLD